MMGKYFVDGQGILRSNNMMQLNQTENIWEHFVVPCSEVHSVRYCQNTCKDWSIEKIGKEKLRVCQSIFSNGSYTRIVSLK